MSPGQPGRALATLGGRALEEPYGRSRQEIVVVDYAPGELARLERSLRRLLPHCARACIALTGGVAVDHHLSSRGQRPSRSRLNDLDVVARDIEAISPAVCGEFLVSHYHKAGPAVPKALLQLVDPETRLRVDIFPDLDGVVVRALSATAGKVPVCIVDVESLIRHKLRTIAKASPSSPVDPKHRCDVIALDPAAEVGLPPPDSPLFRKDRYATALDALCPRCAASQGTEFALAPKTDIYRLLGYV